MKVRELWQELAELAEVENIHDHEKIAKKLRKMVIESQDYYTELLELLPQDLSNPYTDPKLVAKGVERNTFDKSITQDDVEMIINETEDFEDLKNQLIKYFELSEDNQ